MDVIFVPSGESKIVQPTPFKSQISVLTILKKKNTKLTIKPLITLRNFNVYVRSLRDRLVYDTFFGPSCLSAPHLKTDNSLKSNKKALTLRSIRKCDIFF